MRSAVTGAVILVAWSFTANAIGADSFDGLAKEYSGQIRPLLTRYCLDCHSAEDKEGDLNLEAFNGLNEIRRSPGTWRKVAEMLDSGEMPPKDSPKPAADERGLVRGWVGRYLHAEALANAGDPGPVVLRRLNNAQYTYTLQDLTGFDFKPAREFPADSAAGEGFTNTGDALVMSPALLGKYLEAGKKIAAHAVLLPDGFRFAAGETRRDWTDDILASIRALYARYADDEGRIPLEKYLKAAIEHLPADRVGLNARYLETVERSFSQGDPSPVFDPIRARWKSAKPVDAPAIAAEIDAWQKALTRFQSVGHMKPRVADVDPVVTRQNLSFKLPEAPDGKALTVHLAAGGVQRTNVVVWENLRIARPGRPDIALRDVRGIAEGLAAHRAKVVESAARCLSAADEALAAASPAAVDRNVLAHKHNVAPEVLGAWLDCLGAGVAPELKLDLFSERMTQVGGYDAAAGWGKSETPLVVANSSDETLHIPGELKGRGVVVHPSPTLRAAGAWACPAAGEYRIEGFVKHAHPACGNGTVWRLELRRGTVRLAFGEGNVSGGAPGKIGPFGPVALNPGDLVVLTIGPRDGNHACDLTAVDLTLTDSGDAAKTWNMAAEVSADALAANPHADRFGNADVWRFFREPEGNAVGLALPAGSILARWLETRDASIRGKLSTELQNLLVEGPTGAPPADASLYRALTSPGGPIISAQPSIGPIPADSAWGRNPDEFGPSLLATGIAPVDLAVKSPSIVSVRIPAELAAGAELVGTAVLRPVEGGDDFVQLRIGGEPPTTEPGLKPDAPVLIAGAAAEGRMKRAFSDFRSWFPPVFCYAKIVPVDEAVTLTLFHREDEPLRRLMLDEAEAARLDRLWEELHFVSQDPLTQVQALEHIIQYATQDGDPKLFIPFRKPFAEDAEAFRKKLAEAEPRQLDRLIAFASQAYRRPTTEQEDRDLRGLYAKLRGEDIPHDEAFRLTLARILTAPSFLYRLEKSPDSVTSLPVSDWEAANRLSYFLTSSAPDEELRKAAATGRLRDPNEIATQARRLLKSPNVRRLAEEFACQWLHIYGFDAQDEKSARHFPTFAAVKGAMYEEAIRFFADLFQSDASVLSIYNADHAFLNQTLAEHYGIPGVTGPEWRRVDGVRKYGRGGILGLSATLAKESGASRTSPILRGNWVTEVLLGERTPKPPKDVPILPDDEASGGGLSVRQLVEKHTRDIRCSGCHAKMDPYGFSLEAYDAIGRFRERDTTGQSIDARAKLLDGSEFNGVDGLRNHLLTTRRDAVERQFCKKLLGYALGRGLTISDEPLLDEILSRLNAEEHRVSSVIDAIVRSRQFREIRGTSPTVAEVR